MTWNEAIQKVLKIEGKPANANRILELITTHGIREVTGKTPVDTIGAMLATSPKLFIRTEPGLFRLRNPATDPVYVESVLSAIDDEEDFDSEAENLITYYGLMWPRSDTNLRRGLMQGMLEGEPISLDGKRGVYLLYLGETLVYVGRVTDRTIAKRLDEHTKDNLGHRWDRFSFFLFNQVDLDAAIVTVGIEALLLEVLNPACNRS